MSTNIFRAIILTIMTGIFIFLSAAIPAYAATPETIRSDNHRSIFSYISQPTEITLKEATTIAYNHVGVEKQDVLFTTVDVYAKDGKYEYYVTFYVGMVEYFHIIDSTGKILECKETDYSKIMDTV